MRQATRMHDHARVGQVPYEQSHSARMIHVNVCQKDIVDCITRYAQLLERGQQMRNRVVRSGVNECCPPVMPNNVHGRVSGMHIFGIDSKNSVRMSSKSRLHGL